MSAAYYWCLHCWRAFIDEPALPRSPFRGPDCCCPYEDCDGSPMDFWDWSKISKGTQYPAVPIAGVEYGQFGGEPVIDKQARFKPWYRHHPMHKPLEATTKEGNCDE